MSYIKNAELYLENYTKLLKSIKNAEYMMQRLQWKSRQYDLRAACSDGSGRRGNFISATEKEFDEYLTWREIRAANEEAVRHIEEALASLGQEPMGGMEEKLLRLWYIEKMPKEDIAAELGYETRKSVYELRKKVLTKFTVLLFGILALREINGDKE